MTKGWFVGNFYPTIINTDAIEIGVKFYPKNCKEDKHHHKISTEITVVISGKVIINEEIFSNGDIIVIEPNESAEFSVLEDAITVVVKKPSVKNDKYIDCNK